MLPASSFTFVNYKLSFTSEGNRHHRCDVQNWYESLDSYTADPVTNKDCSRSRGFISRLSVWCREHLLVWTKLRDVNSTPHCRGTASSSASASAISLAHLTHTHSARSHDGLVKRSGDQLHLLLDMGQRVDKGI